MLYDSERRFVGVLYGAVPPLFGPQQVARDGEDFAVLKVSELVFGRFSVLSDCKGTLNCCRKPAMAQAPSNARAHLWSRVHSREDVV